MDPCPWMSVDDKIDKEKTKEYFLPERPLRFTRPGDGGHAARFSEWKVFIPADKFQKPVLISFSKQTLFTTLAYLP